MVSRAERGQVSDWWWTVDRWLLSAFIVLMVLGVVLSFAASPAVAERIGLESNHFVTRQIAHKALRGERLTRRDPDDDPALYPHLVLNRDRAKFLKPQCPARTVRLSACRSFARRRRQHRVTRSCRGKRQQSDRQSHGDEPIHERKIELPGKQCSRRYKTAP